MYLFAAFSESKLLALLQKVSIETYQAGDSIIVEGELGTSLFIIDSGSVMITKNGKYIRSLGRFEYVGERALLFEELRSATVVASEETRVYSLDKKFLFNFLDEPMKQYLRKRVSMQDSTVQFDELLSVDKLGKGTFGVVYKVFAERTKTFYALKCVRRSVVLKYNVQRHIN